jgi:hypothetical protein
MKGKSLSILTTKDGIHGFTTGTNDLHSFSSLLDVDAGRKGRALSVKFTELVIRS